MYSCCYVYVILLLRVFRSGNSVSLCCSVHSLCVNVYCTSRNLGKILRRRKAKGEDKVAEM